MKRTDLERMERELRRKQKKDRLQSKRLGGDTEDRGVRGFTEELFELFQYDEIQIYNAEDDEEILELLLEMKEELPSKQWDVVVKKAVRLTKVAEPEHALEALRILLED